jgi:D-arabinose 1-dehydrogenase-like Zn-dependent alcohol dehydrogenase
LSSYAAEGKIQPHVHQIRLEDINDVFIAMKRGEIDGRAIMTF